MVKSYIRLSVRSIISQGLQSVISMSGISIALTCAILIILYVQYELEYDAYHENADHIYRILRKQPGHAYMGKDLFAVTPAPLKNALINDIPEIKNVTQCKLKFHTLAYNSKLFEESGFLYADTDFLEIFTFPVITGNPTEALKEPFTLFMTKDMAVKYFGSDDPVGKTIMADNNYLFTVCGILGNIPKNSHFHFDFLTGFETLSSMAGGSAMFRNWDNFSHTTYIQLFDNATEEDIHDKLNDLANRYLASKPFFKDSRFIAEPLRDIHLRSDSNFSIAGNGDIRYIYLISAVGFLILLIACFNYMNMANARSYNRGRETGILKASGAGNGEVIIQLVTESALISIGGLVVALVIAGILLPSFSSFSERPLTFRMIFEYRIIIKVILLTLATGVLAGIWPAFHLSSITPLDLINENYKALGGNRSWQLRNLLVVVQNVISMVALICTFTVLRQLNFIETSELGFEKENIITVELKDPAIRKNPGTLINELKKNPEIMDLTTSVNLPVNAQGTSYASWEGKPEDLQQFVYRAGIGNDFINFYGLKVISGRGFSDDFPSDTLNNFVINRTAAKIMGLDDPVGKKFGFNKDDGLGTVIGVIEDYHFQSLHLAIEPLALAATGSDGFKLPRYISIRVRPGAVSETLRFIDMTVKELSPYYLNPVSVFSDRVEMMYRSERKLASIFIVSALLAVILTCLGQYSLSSYTTESRTREMVIRKVMGAQPAEIVALITSQTVKWILISLLSAWPIAYLLMTKWLQNFACHINIGAGVFLLSLLIISLISLTAVSYHVIKLARVNPAEMIRHE
ncbi:MAG: FtsX-like permease family protein [Bacteroidales bacterium]|nr:FtsX-like permease family protein [Bacteroidales bacterium]